MSDPIQLSILVLAYQNAAQTRACLLSLATHLKVPAKVVLLANGEASEDTWWMYEDRLCDVLISKRVGQGGGFGQTDLFRWCDTEYALFVQHDQLLQYDITPDVLAQMIPLLNEGGFHCVDLNGDQSGRGVWTDRAHLIKTALFNSLAPFPNGGPGNDALPWNEAHLQAQFAERGYRIAHLSPVFFKDEGQWSVREAGDGIYAHRTDTKQLTVLKQPTYRTPVYPPLDDVEWDIMLSGHWKPGSIPSLWLPHSFRAWPDSPLPTFSLSS